MSIKKWIDDYNFEKFHAEGYGGKYTIAHHMYYEIRDLINRTHCKLSGHCLEDNSIAGPESGNMSVRCSRCGYEWSETLY